MGISGVFQISAERDNWIEGFYRGRKEAIKWALDCEDGEKRHK